MATALGFDGSGHGTFRRTNVVRALAVASTGIDTEEAALAAQRRAIREELGWTA
jgi:hypothetical protein